MRLQGSACRSRLRGLAGAGGNLPQAALSARPGAAASGARGRGFSLRAVALPFGLVTRKPRLVLKRCFGRVNAGCCSFPDLATSGVKDFQAVGRRAVV